MKIFPIFFLLLISVVSFAEDNAFEKADSESKIIKAPAAEKLRVEARGCETAQTHCYQGFRDKKNRWIINLCENIKRYKKGIYTFDSKGLRFFKLSEDDFKISCNDINYEFKADINKRGEIERIKLEWNADEVSGNLVFQLQKKSKLKLEKCVEYGHASEQAKKWDCMPKDLKKLSKKFEVDKKKFEKMINLIGFEELNGKCRKCVHPNSVLSKLEEMTLEYSHSKFKGEMSKLVQLYLAKIEKLRADYKQKAKLDGAKTGEAKIDSVLNDYAEGVKAYAFKYLESRTKP